ncbi:MAG: hypothetical protein LM582_10055 [Desulfurococcaceae archaeon]|nr:hypothetical protein [Desulfurococcaceae archaeon]
MLTLACRGLLEAFASTLGKKVLEEDFSIAVVDSTTPILNVLTTEESKAYLHIILYNLTSSTNDLLILVADLRFATETLDLKSLEFIVDIVFVFKTRIEKDLIHRFIEIRKFRGRPILVAEISFSMGEGRGVRALIT